MCMRWRISRRRMTVCLGGRSFRQRELINFYNPDLAGSPNLSVCPQEDLGRRCAPLNPLASLADFACPAGARTRTPAWSSLRLLGPRAPLRACCACVTRRTTFASLLGDRAVGRLAKPVSRVYAAPVVRCILATPPGEGVSGESGAPGEP